MVLTVFVMFDSLKFHTLQYLFVNSSQSLFISRVFKVLFNTNLVAFGLLKERVKEMSGQKKIFLQ